MSLKKAFKIAFISFAFFTAVLLIIIQVHEYGQLFVLDYPLYWDFMEHNGISFFSIFILMALFLYALGKMNSREYLRIVNYILLFLFILYNTTIVLLFTIASVPLYIRSHAPGASLAGYLDFISAFIMTVMSVIIIITTFFMNRWLLKLKRDQKTVLPLKDN